jgi:hypothetical protein
MTPKSRRKHKGRRESGSFTAIPHAVQDSPNWRRSSATAIKMLCDIARQFNGRNNGDLGASLTVMAPRGWTSSETIFFALRELRHYGLIVLTRQGGLHGASFYALTWHPIDDCGGKLDCSATKVAGGEWKVERAPYKRPPKKRKASTPAVAGNYAIRSGATERAP